jgi:L-asparagine oxygenase
MLTPWALAASQAETERIISAARLCAAVNAAADPEAFIAAADLFRDCLPRRLISKLRSLRRHGHPDGGLLVRGLPVGEVPPADPAAGSGSRLPAAGLLRIIAACLGDQYGFARQLGGRILQDIVPVRGREDTAQRPGNGRVVDTDYAALALTIPRPQEVIG